MLTAPRYRALGWAWTGLAGAALIAVLLFFFWLLVDPDPRAGKTLAFFFVPVSFVTAVFLLPAFIGGIGVLDGRPWGRVLLIVVSALFALAVPVGTVLGGLSLWLLLADELKRNAVAAPPAPEPPPAPAASEAPPAPSARLQALPGLAIAMAFIAAFFIVLLGAGFRLSGTPAPGLFDSGFYPAIVVLVAITGYVVIGRPFAADGATIFEGPSLLTRRRWRREAEAAHRRYADERRALIAHLAADPARRRYAEAMQRGEPWTEAQIDYDMDPAARATCPHLRPIEGAMREAGIRLRRGHGQTAEAACVIDLDALRRRLALAPSVHYAEPPMDGRSREDPLAALLACHACDGSIIHAIHAKDAPPGTPIFPS